MPELMDEYQDAEYDDKGNDGNQKCVHRRARKTSKTKSAVNRAIRG